MNIALIGYGKMGKMIEDANTKLQSPNNIVLKIDSKTPGAIEKLADHKIDVAIDFTTPDAVLTNIGVCLRLNIPLVIGTTGWYEKMEEVKINCEKKNGAIIYGSNFSIGVNLFFKLNEFLSAMMSKQNNYSVSIEETHHTEKKDKPSGTAISLANQIIKNDSRFEKWVVGDAKPALAKASADKELTIISNRENNVTGTHIVKYYSLIDDIEISHRAHSRSGFASGALFAAEFIQHKKGFYNFVDIFSL